MLDTASNTAKVKTFLIIDTALNGVDVLTSYLDTRVFATLFGEGGPEGVSATNDWLTAWQSALYCAFVRPKQEDVT